MTHVCGFGFECPNISNGGINWIVPITANMTIDCIDLDISMMPAAQPTRAGFHEILCQALYMPGPVTPTFSASKQAYVNQIADSGNFGTIIAYDPNGFLDVYGGTIQSGMLTSAILKAWVSTTASLECSRHITKPINKQVYAGDFLVFHMDHASSSGDSMDVEMQGSLTITLPA